MPSSLPPSFHWSPARHLWFRQCLRAYVLRYYVAPAGRSPDAAPRRKEVYALSGLVLREAWARKHLLRVALSFIAGEAGRPEETLRESLRADFRASRQGGHRLSPKSTGGLFEHEYGLRVPDEAWKELVERTVQDLAAFCATEYARALREASAGAAWPAGAAERVDLGGLPVEVRAWGWTRDGAGVQVHAWRVETDDGALRAMERTALAALAMQQARAGLEKVALVEYPFPNGPPAVVPLTAEAWEEGRELIHDSADEMRFLLADPDRDVAREDDFECTEGETACHTCPFLKVCPKWHPPAAPADSAAP